jgi:hypothetical protein
MGIEEQKREASSEKEMQSAALLRVSPTFYLPMAAR